MFVCQSLSEAGSSDAPSSAADVSIDAVIIIAPRKEDARFGSAYSEALVKCTIQVSTNDTDLSREHVTRFMSSFLKTHLVELNHVMLEHRFNPDTKFSHIQSINKVSNGSPTPETPRAPAKRWSIGSPKSAEPQSTTSDLADSRGKRSGQNSPRLAPSLIKEEMSLASPRHNRTMSLSRDIVILPAPTVPPTPPPQPKDTSPPPSQGKPRRFLFRRPKKPAEVHDDSYLYTTQKTSDKKFNISRPDDRGPAGSGDTRKLSKSTSGQSLKGMTPGNAASEVARLKAEIATKEYQLQRVMNKEKTAASDQTADLKDVLVDEIQVNRTILLIHSYYITGAYMYVCILYY